MAKQLDAPELPRAVPPEVRKKILSTYNALEPVSDYNSKHVVVLENKSGMGLLVFLNEDWCVDLINPVTPNQMRGLLSSVTGRPTDQSGQSI